MRKFGFTLAEVLITLGIIGVVAALTAPALVQNTANAQVGPTLAKVTSTLENANQKMMLDEGVATLNSISAAETGGTVENIIGTSGVMTYYNLLSKYIAGSSYETDKTTESDFVVSPTLYDDTALALTDEYVFNFSNSVDIISVQQTQRTTTQKGAFKGQFLNIYVDINGIQTGPNSLGKDIFEFTVDNSGNVLPVGSESWSWAYHDGDSAYIWSNADGDYACNDTTVTKGYGCAGSVLDNNRKVIYQ